MCKRSSQWYCQAVFTKNISFFKETKHSIFAGANKQKDFEGTAPTFLFSRGKTMNPAEKQVPGSSAKQQPLTRSPRRAAAMLQLAERTIQQLTLSQAAPFLTNPHPDPAAPSLLSTAADARSPADTHWKAMAPASRVHLVGDCSFSLRKSCFAWLWYCCRSRPD